MRVHLLVMPGNELVQLLDIQKDKLLVLLAMLGIGSLLELLSYGV